MPREIKAYQTDDGQVFIDHDLAKTHEARMKFERAVHEFCYNHGWSGMTSDDMADIVVEHADFLLTLLKGERGHPGNHVGKE